MTTQQAAFVEKLNQLILFAKLAKHFTGTSVEIPEKQRWLAAYSRDPEKAAVHMEHMLTGTLDILVNQMPATKQPQDGLPGKDGAPGRDGRDAPTMEEIKAELVKLVAEIPNPEDGAAGADGADGADGVDGADAEIDQGLIDAMIETVYQAIDVPLAINQSPEEIRNALELLMGDERLDKAAVRGISEMERDIEALKQIKSSPGGGGTSRKVVQAMIDKSVSNLGGGGSSPRLDATLTYNGTQLSRVTTTAGDTDLTYNGTQLTTVSLPDGVTANLIYNGEQLTQVTYS